MKSIYVNKLTVLRLNHGRGLKGLPRIYAYNCFEIDGNPSLNTNLPTQEDIRVRRCLKATTVLTSGGELDRIRLNNDTVI